MKESLISEYNGLSNKVIKMKSQSQTDTRRLREMCDIACYNKWINDGNTLSREEEFIVIMA